MAVGAFDAWVLGAILIVSTRRLDVQVTGILGDSGGIERGGMSDERRLEFDVQRQAGVCGSSWTTLMGVYGYSRWSRAP